jgi:hypothetical protein
MDFSKNIFARPNPLEYENKNYGCIKVHSISKCKQVEATLNKDNEAFLCGMDEKITRLKQANYQLDREIKEIRQAFKQEPELSKYKACFVSMVSHEF